jgi:hypothetical protein
MHELFHIAIIQSKMGTSGGGCGGGGCDGGVGGQVMVEVEVEVWVEVEAEVEVEVEAEVEIVDVARDGDDGLRWSRGAQSFKKVKPNYCCVINKALQAAP